MPIGLTGRAGVPPTLRARPATSLVGCAGAGDLRAGADLDVADDARLAAHDDEIAQLGGAGNAALGHDHAMAPDDDVVRDLDQIINFGALRR